jgi:hypothetical protein
VKQAFQVLNELERDGVFARYAIGGAMAATFYARRLFANAFGVARFAEIANDLKRQDRQEGGSSAGR